MTGTNGHDLGDMGVRFRPDHAAGETRTRRAGCAFLAAVVAGATLAVLAGVCGGVVGVMVFRW